MYDFAGYKGLCGAPEGGKDGETYIWAECDSSIFAVENLCAYEPDTFTLSNGNEVVGFENAVEWVLEKSKGVKHD